MAIPNFTSYKPASGDDGDANQIANFMTAVEGILAAVGDETLMTWKTGLIFDPAKIKQGGANDGEVLAWSDALGTYAPAATDASVAATGWVAAGETWTYASADAPVYTLTIPTDLTTKYSPGMRAKLIQGGYTKFFIILAVSYSSPNTTLTLLSSMTSGTPDNSGLTSATITSPSFSTAKAPYGFPIDPTRWTVSLSDTSDRTQASPANSTWYNLGSLSLTIPIGAWDVSFAAVVELILSAGDGRVFAALSTGAATASDGDLIASGGYVNTSGGTLTNVGGSVVAGKRLVLAAKTVYYLNAMTFSSGTKTTLGFYASTYGINTKVEAVCAYL